MGRKKDINPMEAYRRKQKKAQIAKNKKKRAEAKEKALQKRPPEWIMSEIQKLNRREKQEQGKNEEKFKHQRNKLLEAFNRANRIKRIKEKTKSKTTSSKDTNSDNESSPTPPPIEGVTTSKPTKPTTTNHSNNNSNNKPTNPPNSTHPIIPTINPMTNPLLNPATNLYNPLYPNPLLMNPYHPQIHPQSIYSDTLGSKSHHKPIQQQQSHPIHPALHPYSKQQSKPRRARDAYDPLNPANPKYNFIYDKTHNQSQPQQQMIHPSHPLLGGPPAVKPQAPSVKVVEKKEEDITKMQKPKREIEVIMDPKLRSMMPSSMRFKRKFEKSKTVRPTKKRKLNLAPEVDHDAEKQEVSSNKNNNRNVKKNNFNTGDADAAYDKFMDEISGLI